MAATPVWFGLWSKDGIVFSCKITRVTLASVAEALLGNRVCKNSPCKVGGAFLRSSWFRSWHSAQSLL
jgi:hypothetical protein